jgi:hypothetical protein
MLAQEEAKRRALADAAARAAAAAVAAAAVAVAAVEDAKAAGGFTDDDLTVKFPVKARSMLAAHVPPGEGGFRVTEVAKGGGSWDAATEQFKSSLNGMIQVYVGNRQKAKLKPIKFRVVRVKEVSNPVLAARFAECKQRLVQFEPKRSRKYFKEHYAFHGTTPGRGGPDGLERVCQNGLLRVGHPLNPSPCVGGGGGGGGEMHMFGDCTQGVYVSRHADMCLRYCNDDLAPMEPGQKVWIVMVQLLHGKSMRVKEPTPEMAPTLGYDSHESAQRNEWFLFDESQCHPTHVLEVEAYA